MKEFLKLWNNPKARERLIKIYNLFKAGVYIAKGGKIYISGEFAWKMFEEKGVYPELLEVMIEDLV